MKELFKKSMTMENTNGRSDVRFSRWTKYGKDRIYVSYGSKGHQAGYIDLTVDKPEYICDSTFDCNIVIDCVNRLLAEYRF